MIDVRVVSVSGRLLAVTPVNRSGIEKRGHRAGPNVAAMTAIESIILEVPDPKAANDFYAAAFGLDTQLGLRATDTPTTGFRGFTLSLVVSQPSTVDALIGPAIDAGATPLKPAAKGFCRKYVEFASPVDAGQAGALRAPCPRQGRRHLPGRHRIAPDRHRRRCRDLHRPGRVRVGGHVSLRSG